MNRISLKNKRMTTNTELERYAKENNIPLIAVITKDLLEPIKQKKGGYIINLGNSNTGGTHWTALFLDTFTPSKKKYAFYMDSYGMPMPKEVEEYALKWTKSPLYIIENTKKIQGLKSGYCGQYSILFINEMKNDKNNLFQNFANYLNMFKISRV